MGKPWEYGDLYGKSPFFMSKSTISMAIFNSYVCLPVLVQFVVGEALVIRQFAMGNVP